MKHMNYPKQVLIHEERKTDETISVSTQSGLFTLLQMLTQGLLLERPAHCGKANTYINTKEVSHPLVEWTINFGF